MTDQERAAVESLVYALARVQWSLIDLKCPLCGRAKAYGHTCGCPVNIAWKGARKQAWEAKQGQYLADRGHVAQCDTCRWWKPFNEVRHLGDCELFECRENEQVHSASMLIVTRTQSGAATIVTHPGFGCVQWEARQS